MRRSPTFLFTAAVLLASLVAKAQTGFSYTGPRYPGGPDSLRALVYRSTRLAAPGSTGLAVVQFELKNGTEPGNFRLLGPGQTKKSDLSKATQAALGYLQAQVPTWQLAEGAKWSKSPKVMLALNFGLPQSAQPYSYADQEPLFSYLDAPLHTADFDHSKEIATLFATPGTTYQKVADYVQRGVRYPADAMRSQQQGKVNIYFEVAENGSIEHPEIISSAGSFLDAEVLRVVKTLRPATTPALLQGRPVRVAYVLPVTFKMI